jgi:MEMO1 family protein
MIREPVVAGQFYPGDPKTLRRDVHSYLVESRTLLEAKAIVSPHAGYIYSGSVAGAVFSAVRLPKKFIILGPNHTGWGAPISLAPNGRWRTPMGSAEIDRELNLQLLASCPRLEQEHTAHLREHSLEVQLPFLQALVPEFCFAAICVATTDYEVLEEFGHSLAQVVQASPEPILMVVSSDMNHYESAEVASQKDHWAIDRILALDARGLFRIIGAEDISMCGFAPTVSAIIACRDLGATEGRLVRYANSGNVSGDYGSVVGYAGLAIV